MHTKAEGRAAERGEAHVRGVVSWVGEASWESRVAVDET